MKFKKINPFFRIVSMYIILILVGALLLKIPFFINEGYSVNIVESLFTSVSAFTTTGLTVFDYTNVYNNFGQILMIIFFNIGGMGIMTVNTLVFILIGRKIGVHHRVLARIDLNQQSSSGLVTIARTIIIMFLTTELVGTILIFFKIGYKNFSFFDRFVNSWYMSASAVTGSGFYNTVDYKYDYYILIVLMFLMVFSFIGYPALIDFLEFTKSKIKREKKKYKFSNFTKVSVMVNFITIVMFALIFISLEYDNAMAVDNWFEKILYAFYFSTSTKSVGLSVFGDINTFHTATLLFTTIFMIIGGAPSSACGGIRVTTVYVMYVNIRSLLRNNPDSEYGNYKFPDKTVIKAYFITIMFMFSAFSIYVLILIVNQQKNLFNLWFDVISAITTTGFSTGEFNTLNVFGILMISLLMFIGRIGIVNLSGSIRHKKKHVDYIEKDIII